MTFHTPSGSDEGVLLLQSHRYLLLSVFQILAILLSTQWCLIVILIFISLLTYDVEHLFIWLFAICPPFLGRPLSHLFKYFLHFLTGLLVFSLLSFEGFVYSGNNPLSDMYFEKIFLPVYSLSFYFLNSFHKAIRVLSYLLVSVCVCVCVCVCNGQDLEEG